MTRASRATNKGYFETGDIPTEAQFATLIDSCYNDMATPEDYGAAGDGVTDDSTAVQAAIDANENVRLINSYMVTMQGTTSLQQYPGANYCILVNQSNRHIWGPGKLLVNDITGVTNNLHLLAFNVADAYLENVGVHGVVFDGSALTGAQQDALSLNNGGMVNFYQCRYVTVEACRIIEGWGYAGIFTVQSLSEYVNILNNWIACGGDTAGRGSGMWLDGFQHGLVSGNYVYNASAHGIFLAVNNDNDFRRPLNVRIIGNECHNWRGGVGIGITGGADCEIAANIVDTDGLPSSGTGISLIGSGAVNKCERNNIHGNRIRLSGSAKGQGIYTIATSDDGAVINNFIHGNYTQGFSYGVNLGNYTQDNDIVNNRLDNYTGTAIQTSGTTGVSGNVTTPNY